MTAAVPSEASIIFWNLNGLSKLSHCLPQDFPERTAILGLYETMSTSEVLPLPSGWSKYKLVTAPAIRERSLGRPSGGLANLFDPDWTTHDLLEKNTLYTLSLCSLSTFQFILGTIYIRPQADLKTALDLLQDSLDQTRDRYRGMPVILGGDFNARVGSAGENLSDILEDTCLLPSCHLLDPPCPPKGDILANFMSDNGFILLNGRTVNDHPGQYTFVGHQGKSTIDLVYINFECTNFILDLIVLPHVSLSDHLPVCLKIALPTPAHMNEQLTGHHLRTLTRLRWDGTQLDTYAEAIDTQLRLTSEQANQCPSSVALNEELSLVIRNSATQSGMLISIPPRGNAKPGAIWFDHECVLWKKNLTAALKLAKSNNFADPYREEFLLTKRHFKNIVENKKLAHDKKIRDKFSLVRNSKEFWAAFRSLKRGHITVNPIHVNDWVSFFQFNFSAEKSDKL